MPLLRTIRAICIGVALFYGLALVVKYFPRVFRFFAFLGLLAAGAFILFTAVNALKKGRIGTRYGPPYDCRNNPIEYWFFVLFFFLMGALICITALYFLLHKPGIR